MPDQIECVGGPLDRCKWINAGQEIEDGFIRTDIEPINYMELR